MPDWRPEIRARLTGVRLSPAREAEIIEELSQHLEDRWREQVAAGADPEVELEPRNAATMAAVLLIDRALSAEFVGSVS